MIDPERAMQEPSAVFSAPEDVAACAELSTGEKVRALVQWSIDARELNRSAANGGAAGHGDLLDRIDATLARLDESEWRVHEAPPQRSSSV